jgi:acetoin utilization deacetylase AcuC-like enzyme
LQDGDSSVADSIEQLWKSEQQTISEKNDQSTSDELENSSHEFSFMLSRVVLPRLIDEFQKMIAEISGKSFPLKSPALDTYHQIMKYCQSYGQAHEDTLSVLCTLSDFVGRIEHSASADQKQLIKIKEREEKEFLRFSQLRESRDSKLSFLKGEGEDKLVANVCEELNNELRTMKQELAGAIYEEEEARKAYERAVAQTKAIKDKLAKLVTVSTLIEDQRDILISVNENHSSIDSILEGVCKNRVAVVTSMQSVLHHIWSTKLKDTVYSSALSTFQQLWAQFLGPEQVDTFKLRIGKEILTLWRKQVSKQSTLHSLINGSFEDLSRIPANNNILLLSEESGSSQSTEDFSSATVVLYNTLNYHETPSDHVETQARTRTAIKTILHRFQDQRKVSLEYNNSQSSQRSLALKECNDVTSVPLYCLPLVHSPQYLRRLYKFSKEAEEDDLFVPLEFDTEWETELEYSDSDSDYSSDQELFTGRPSCWTKLRKIDESSLSAMLENRLPKDKIQKFAKFMNPTRQEFRWAELLNKAATNVHLNTVIRHSNTNVANVRKSLAPGRKYRVGRRVKTIYGDGVIIDDNPSRVEIIYKVQLQWGAMAFLNEACILLAYRRSRHEVRRSSPNTENRDSVGNGPQVSTGTAVNTAPKSEASFSHPKFCRFSCTDLRLHRLVVRILEIAKLNRFVGENAGLRDAHFSLWLYGRTGTSASNATEVEIRKWLLRYDPHLLHELLTRYESLKGTNIPLHKFAADLRSIDNTNPNTDKELVIIGCSNDPEVLRKEASEYCQSKLVTKSGGPRASGIRKRRSRHSEGNNGGGEASVNETTAEDRRDDSSPTKKRRRKIKQEDTTANHSESNKVHSLDKDKKNDGGVNNATLSSSPRRRRNREKRLKPIHFPLRRSDLPPIPDNLYELPEDRQYYEDVRFLFARLMQLMPRTQSQVVQDLAKRFNFHCAQASLSSWMRHKLTMETMCLYVDVLMRWICIYAPLLRPEDQALLQQLLQEHPTVGYSRCFHTARKPPVGVVPNSSSTASVVPTAVKSEPSNPNSSSNNLSAPLSTSHDILSRFGATLLHPPAAVSASPETGAALATAADTSAVTIEVDGDDDDSGSSSELMSMSSVGAMDDATDHGPTTAADASAVTIEVDDEDDGSDSSSELMSMSSIGAMDDSTNHHESNANAILPQNTMNVPDTELSSRTDDEEDKNHEHNDGKHGDETGSIEQDKQEVEDLEKDEFNESDNSGDDEGVPFFTVKMIRGLLTEFVAQTDRRMVSHLYVDAEARGLGLRLPQPMISSFVRSSSSKKNEFYYDALKWVDRSKALPPPYLKDAAGRYSMKDTFCSACNRLSSTFASRPAFYDHMRVCPAAPKLSNKSVKVTFDVEEDGQKEEEKEEEEEYEDVDEGDENEGGSPSLRRRRSFVDLSQFQLSSGEIQDAEDRLAKELIGVQIYPFNLSLKFSLCAHCGETGGGGSARSSSSLIPCHTCPSQYHLRCITGQERAREEISEDDWCCPVCEETGIADSIELTEDAKRHELAPGTEIFCFFPEHRSWKKGVFLAMYSKQPNFGLVRFLHFDQHPDNGKDVDGHAIQWINLDLSVIRMAVNDPAGTNGPTRGRLGRMNRNGVGSRRSHRESLRADPASNTNSRTNLQRQRVRTTFFHEDANNSSHQPHHQLGSGRGHLGRSVGHSSSLPTGTRGGSRKSLGEISGTEAGASELKKSTHTPSRRGKSHAVVKSEGLPSESNLAGSSTGSKQVPRDDTGDGMSDTYISATTMKAALASAGIACKAVDVVLQNVDTNAFACIRPPGHHAGRHGCTRGCLSTGFCILNNAAIALVYSRVRYGLTRVAVVDFDVHFGNGTADILQGDPNAFFASVHMVYGPNNDGQTTEQNLEDASTHGKSRPVAAGTAMGFYPAQLGRTEITDNYVCIGVQPENVSKLLQKRAQSLQSLQAQHKAKEAQEREAVAMMPNSGDDERDPSVTTTHIATASVIDRKKEAASSAIDSDSDESDLQSISDEESPSMDVDESGPDITNSSQPQPTKSESTQPQGEMPTEFVGSRGFLDALQYAIIPKLEAFAPELLIISAGFDGYRTDPIGGALHLSLDDYSACTAMLMNAMKRISIATNDPQRETRVISLLEGGYDTSPATLGLAKCVERHVMTLRCKT